MTALLPFKCVHFVGIGGIGMSAVAEMVQARKRNYRFLQQRLREWAELRVAAVPKEGDCPLVYPVRVSRRDDLRRYLMDQKIYCAVHWPMAGTPMERTASARYAQEELSLPIDQRYDEKELMYLVEKLWQYRSN